MYRTEISIGRRGAGQSRHQFSFFQAALVAAALVAAVPAGAALVAAALVAVGFTSIAQAAVVPAQSGRIVAVTVYPDRAEVVREVRLDFPAGSSTVEFPDIPSGIEADSLRATAKGVPLAIGAVDLKERAEAPVDSPDFVAAQAEIDRIGHELATMRAEAATAGELRAFLTSLRATATDQASKGITEGKLDPAAIQGLYTLIRNGLDQLAKDEVLRNERSDKSQREMRIAQAKLATAWPARSIRSRVATVEIDAERAGSATVRLSYLVPGASWRPSYRASLDAATGKIGLVSEAVVHQRSGEDWTDVALSLSTAAPARGVEPPVLSSLLLRPLEAMAQANDALRNEAGYKQAAGGYRRISGVSGGVEGGVLAGVFGGTAAEGDDEGKNMPAAAPAPEESSLRKDAGIVASSYNVVFEVPGRSDVPADGTDRRVGLKEAALQGEVEYRTVPAFAASAFLMAKTHAPEGYPLLSGAMRVFADAAYLGSYGLAETAPGAELTLPFGVDNRVKVIRIKLPRERGEEGFIGKDRKIVQAFRTTIENRRDQKIRLVLEDRVPVAEDDRIQVERGKNTTPGAKDDPDRPGVIAWTLDLAPGEKREIVLEYSVRFPKDLFVPGVE